MSNKSILILNARRRVFLVEKMRSYISKNNLEIKIITSDTNMLDPIRFFSDDFILLPPTKDQSFSKELKRYIREKNIIGLMIWYDSDFEAIYEISEEIMKLGVRVLLPSKKIFDICNDKRETYKYFKERGILMPKIYYFNSFEEFDNKNYPLFLKPFDGAGSMHSYKIENRKMLESLYWNIPNPIIQEYIEGEMYTVDAFCDYESKPLCVVPRKRLKVRDSEALISKIDLDEEIIEVATKVLKELGIVGPVNLQFIKNRDGEVYLIEINPRISGGIELSIMANAIFHIWIIQYFLGLDFDEIKGVTDNLIMTRYYSSVFFEDRHIET